MACATHVEKDPPAVDACDAGRPVQCRRGGDGRPACWRREREGGGQSAGSTTAAGRRRAAAT